MDLTGAVTRNEDFLPLMNGQFSDLYRGSPAKPDCGLPATLAVKALRGSRSQEKEFFEAFTKRAARWVTFKHPNVARFYGYARDYGPMPAVVMDFYTNGTAVQYVKAKQRSFDEKLGLIRDIADGLSYLHALNPPIIHGDLRGANVFITSDEPAPRAVIADYELAFIIDTQNFTTYKPAGNVRWTAPEFMVIPEDDSDDDDYVEPKPDTRTDVFAFAMTILEVFTGELPFALKKKETAVMRLISEGGRPEIPAEIREHPWLEQLLHQCWNQDPAVRPSAAQIKETLSAHMKQAQPAPRTGFFSYLMSFFWKS